MAKGSQQWPVGGWTPGNGSSWIARTTKLPAYNNFTITAWVNHIVVDANWRVIFAYYQNGTNAGVSMGISGSSGQLYLEGSSSFQDPAGTVVANTWYHYAMSCTAGTLKFYRNGVQIGSSSTSTNTALGAIIWSNEGFGSQCDAYYGPHSIYNRGLTDQEIALLYKYPYDFDTIVGLNAAYSGQTRNGATDLSGNGNHATLVGTINPSLKTFPFTAPNGNRRGIVYAAAGGGSSLALFGNSQAGAYTLANVSQSLALQGASLGMAHPRSTSSLTANLVGNTQAGAFPHSLGIQQPLLANTQGGAFTQGTPSLDLAIKGNTQAGAFPNSNPSLNAALIGNTQAGAFPNSSAAISMLLKGNTQGGAFPNSNPTFTANLVGNTLGQALGNSNPSLTANLRANTQGEAFTQANPNLALALQGNTQGGAFPNSNPTIGLSLFGAVMAGAYPAATPSFTASLVAAAIAGAFPTATLGLLANLAGNTQAGAFTSASLSFGAQLALIGNTQAGAFTQGIPSLTANLVGNAHSGSFVQAAPSLALSFSGNTQGGAFPHSVLSFGNQLALVGNTQAGAFASASLSQSIALLGNSQGGAFTQANPNLSVALKGNTQAGAFSEAWINFGNTLSLWGASLGGAFTRSTPSLSTALLGNSQGGAFTQANPNLDLAIKGNVQSGALVQSTLSLLANLRGDAASAAYVNGTPTVTVNLSANVLGGAYVIANPSLGVALSGRAMAGAYPYGYNFSAFIPTSLALFGNTYAGSFPLGSLNIGIVPPAPPIKTQPQPNLIAKALSLPLAKQITEAKGIHQSDVVIRQAIIAAIQDLRAFPYLLEYVFSSLISDTLTNDTYGEKEREKAIEWFKCTEIPVIMDISQNVDPMTCISISLIDSVEAESTLGDVHYEPTEETEAEWAPLTPTFAPSSYNPMTGIMKIPTYITKNVTLVADMVVLDNVGKPYPILKVYDNTTIAIKVNSVADFTRATIKSSKPKFVTQLESLSFKESYRIGAHVIGDPQKLIWLHSILVFILLRYKQDLIESRGLERTTIASSSIILSDTGQKEVVWTRHTTLTGYVRHYWPKTNKERLLTTLAKPSVGTVGNTSKKFVAQDHQTEETSNWLAQDGIGYYKTE